MKKNILLLFIVLLSDLCLAGGIERAVVRTGIDPYQPSAPSPSTIFVPDDVFRPSDPSGPIIFRPGDTVVPENNNTLLWELMKNFKEKNMNSEAYILLYSPSSFSGISKFGLNDLNSSFMRELKKPYKHITRKPASISDFSMPSIFEERDVNESNTSSLKSNQKEGEK